MGPRKERAGEQGQAAVAAASDAAAAATATESAERQALRDALRSLLPPRQKDECTGADDIFEKLGLARHRDAALGLKGTRLFAKLQMPTPPVLHDPPG